jgi:hypothetical protein
MPVSGTFTAAHLRDPAILPVPRFRIEPGFAIEHSNGFRSVPAEYDTNDARSSIMHTPDLGAAFQRERCCFGAWRYEQPNDQYESRCEQAFSDECGQSLGSRPRRSNTSAAIFWLYAGVFCSTPYGIRTRATGVKGACHPHMQDILDAASDVPASFSESSG